MTIKKDKIRFFPNYFKIVGTVIMILAFVPMVVITIMKIEIAQNSKETFKILTMNFFILGLLFIALAKDKIEDEMTLYVKLMSMAFAFSWAVLYVIIKSLIDLIFKNPIGEFSSHQLVITMLFVYLTVHYFKKKSR